MAEGLVGPFTRLAAELPSWLDLDFVRTTAAVLVLVALVLLVVTIFMVRSIGTRVIAVVVLGVAVFGLLHYRQSLSDCAKQGCECKLFGEDLKGDACGNASR